MSKYPSQNETIPAADLLPSYDQIQTLAIQTQLIQRQSSKFCPMGFLLMILKSSVTGHTTLNEMAAQLAKTTSNAMSRSGLFQRFSTSTTQFLNAVLYHILSQKWRIDHNLKDRLPFKRILIEDSTQLRMNPLNSQEFPAHGNASGATAGCKIDLCYDILNSQPVNLSLHQATTQDKDCGKDIIDLIQESDCVLRDMGYFSRNEFLTIEKKSAYWLSRLPANVYAAVSEKSISQPTKNPHLLTIESVLARTDSESVDMMVEIGKESPHTARLVAVRVDEKTLQKRLRERNARDKKRGKQSSWESKLRDQWHIMVTNISEEEISLPDLSKLYQLRWQIEINFKAWKQAGSLKAALGKKSNPAHLESVIIGSMIRMALCFKLSPISPTSKDSA